MSLRIMICIDFDALISNAFLELEFDRFKRSPAAARTDIPGRLQRSVNSGLGALVPEPKIDICRLRHIRLIPGPHHRAIAGLPLDLTRIKIKGLKVPISWRGHDLATYTYGLSHRVVLAATDGDVERNAVCAYAI
ncbi:hypothetical protein FPSE_04181 [Fusarium pseudograminearum CS3096]|uniref:Uncharacterized protein n=1 Tax=Fusarium pseudograminearum (strain CS3096) TaxID=1028729 RepID=K3W1C9_FUSPC|nr:hypothetical protein FPSE_04181 [Fusarium pseudograminearum CS3096]EKJ75680.1 hypothetical protein FPSE_04181 [Fusarium pseudograminearum CS3096]